MHNMLAMFFQLVLPGGEEAGIQNLMDIPSLFWTDPYPIPGGNLGDP